MRALPAAATGIVKAAQVAGVGVSAVQRIKASLDDAAHAAISAEIATLRETSVAGAAD